MAAEGDPRLGYGGINVDTGETLDSPAPRPQYNPEFQTLLDRIHSTIQGTPAAPMAAASVQLAAAAQGLPASVQSQIRTCLGPAAVVGGAAAMQQQAQSHADNVADRQAEFERNLRRQRDPASINNPGACNSINDAIGSLRGQYNSFLGTVAGGLGLIVGAIAAVPAAIIGAVTGAIQSLTQAIASGVSSVINLAIGAVCTATSALSALLGPVNSALQAVGQAVSRVTSAITSEIASVASTVSGAFIAGTKVVPASFRCLTPNPYAPEAPQSLPA